MAVFTGNRTQKIWEMEHVHTSIGFAFKFAQTTLIVSSSTIDKMFEIYTFFENATEIFIFSKNRTEIYTFFLK